MKASEAATDLRLWIGISIAASLLLPKADLPTSYLIIAVLMIQMTLSVDGLKLSLGKLKEDRKGSLISIFLCYALNTAVTLAAGVFFMGWNDDLWHGWIMLACMPCAIAVVTAATLLRGSVETAVTAVTATYLAGVILTPLLSFLLIGDAVNPFQILKYILLFIIIPVIVSRPLGHLKLTREAKVPVINLTMALMVFFSVNSNREFIMHSADIVFMVLGISVLRLLSLYAIMSIIVKFWNPGPECEGPYLVLGVWKNTGLAVSMSMLLLADASSAIPCFISMIVETVWFSIITRPGKQVRQSINNPDRDTDSV